MSLQYQPRNGRHRTVSTESNKKRVDELIKEARRVTLKAVATKLGIWHNAVQEMIGSLGYGNICAPLVTAFTY
jgi:predicted ArsR family transcriptional regulator